MSNVLYRKYRSSNFDEILGQDHITKILKNAIRSDQLSHAYLFVGSRGTGKTSVARILAKAVNCTHISKDGNPCGKCEICKGITEGNFLDLIEVDAASNRGIDQIRDLKERIEFSPTEGKYKVYIIDEVHMLTSEAFNALLKTLEEPPAHIIFILATTDVHKLPATILSRCQRYDFRLGTEKEIEQLLTSTAKSEGLKVDKEAMDILVRNAKGSYRDALSLLDVIVNGQLKSDNPKKITQEEVREILSIPETIMVDNLISSLISQDAKKALGYIKELENKGANLQQFTNFTLGILREALVAKISGNEKGLDYNFAKDISPKELLVLINAFLGVERDLKNTANQSLILEMLIPVFCFKDEVVVATAPKISKPTPEDKRGKTIVQQSSEEVQVVNRDSSQATLAEIKKNWNQITQEIKPVNGHLCAFLGTANPVSVKKDVINIEVPFQFHKEQIDSPTAKSLITKAVADVIGIQYSIRCTVNDKVKPRIQVCADVVLKNAPVTKKKEEGSNNDNFFKKPKLSKDVEALFDGM
jgi:DNA polymerase-3 subunit gamma/tau